MSSDLVELAGPTDAVSSLSFNPYNPIYLLASSWDCHLRLFDVNTKTLVRDFTERAPILDATFLTETFVVSASIDGYIRFYDLERGLMQHELLVHKSAISSLEYSAPHNLLVAGSWDKSISVHDTSSSPRPMLQLDLPEKVFALSSNHEHLVVAMSNRQVHIYSWTQLHEAMVTSNSNLKATQRRESSLKFMTRTIQCTLTDDPNLAGYVSTSIEGRVAVEFFDPSEDSQARKYAFKCHRQKGHLEQGHEEDIVHPVNAIQFHPIHKTFASGGGDGVVSLWDLKAKKRVKQYPSVGAEVQTLAFSSDAKLLAIGTGSLGSTEHIKSGTIFLRTLRESEGKGKC